MRKFRVRLTLIFTALIGLTICISGVYTAKILKDSHIQTLQDGMLREIKLIYSAVEWKSGVPLADQIKYFQAEAGRLQEIADARITFMDDSGVVLGDSDHNAKSMDNHLQREEVQLAQASRGAGYSIRYSETLERNMLYAAYPVIEDGKIVGYIRLALSLQVVEEATNQWWKTMGIGLAIVFLLVGLINYRLASGLTRPLEKMTHVAHQIAKRQYDSRVDVRRSDEIGQLGQAINTMASSLELQMNRIIENEQRLKSVLDHMISGVLLINERGELVLFNQAAEKLLDIKEEHYLGRSYTDLKQHHQFVEWIKICELSRGPIREDLQIFYPEERNIEMNVVPMTPVQEKWNGMVIVLHDITDIRRLEQMRSEFVANVSHELKTPIAAIKGFSETLLSGALQDEETARSFLKIIYDESERLNRLVADLLELSQIESGRSTLQFSPVHVHSLMLKSVEMLGDQAKKKKITLDLEVEQDLYIEADEDRLRQIILNLVANGINYTPDGGKVSIKVHTVPKSDQPNEEDEEKIRIEISDTGVGIPKKDLNRIFERFYRVDKARSRGSGGTGLGLSIVKHLVELHKGTLSVKSEIGIGTTFSIELPVIQQEL